MARSEARTSPNLNAPSRIAIPLLTGASLLARILEWVVLALLLFFFTNAVLSHFNDVDRHPVFRHAAAINKTVERPLLAWLRASIPTKVNGQDAAGLFLIGGTFLLWIFLGGTAGFLKAKARRLRQWGEQRAITKGDAALLQKHQEMKSGTLDRAKLLEIYAETKKSLERHKKHYAFLSIDVVDSTGMKKFEDPGIAERDFRKYKSFVEKALSTNRALKSTWTPDGVMICFATADQAIQAAQDVIKSLKAFNDSVKAIKADFKIRAGINSGEVFCDDQTPMEEMTDRVIDIAGHMQKHGAVNAVSIAQHAVEPFLSQFHFASAGRVVDGCPVYEWKETGDTASVS